MVPTMCTSLFSPMIIIGMVLLGVVAPSASVTMCSSPTTIVGGGFFLIRVLGSSLSTFRLVLSVGAIRVIQVIIQFRGIISHVIITVPRLGPGEVFDFERLMESERRYLPYVGLLL